MAEGYIKLHRKLLESSVFDNPNVLKVWIWCLLKATHQPHEQLVGLQNVQLLPGQFIFGRDKHSKELRFSRSSLYRYINVLKSLQMLDIKTNNKFSLVTIVNWELYQSLETKADSKTSIKRTANEQQMDTNKNVKNVKNDIPPISPKGNDVKEDKFLVFWKAYPKKVGKGAAEKSFAKFNPNDTLLKTMVESINQQKQSERWQKENGQYIPNPATWLNQKRWEDELTVTTIPAEQPAKRKFYKTVIENGQEVSIEVDK